MKQSEQESPNEADNNRDKLWCAAILSVGLDMREVEKIVSKALSLRSDPKVREYLEIPNEIYSRFHPPKGETPSEAAGEYTRNVDRRAALKAAAALMESSGQPDGARILRDLRDNLAPGTPIEKAARAFASAWASWHDHSGLMLDDDLIAASNGILEALGLELVDDEKGRHTCAAVDGSGLPREPRTCGVHHPHPDPVCKYCKSAQGEPAPLDGGPIAPPPTTSGPAQEPAAGQQVGPGIGW